jgi:hypothetical protein
MHSCLNRAGRSRRAGGKEKKEEEEKENKIKKGFRQECLGRSILLSSSAMSCPDGSFWTIAPTNGTTTCVTCPAGYGTYVADAIGKEACFQLNFLSTVHADTTLLVCTWLCACTIIIASLFYYAGKLSTHWVRAAYTLYLAERCVLDLVLCHWVYTYPATLSPITFQPIIPNSLTFRRTYLACTILAIFFLLLCTRFLLGHACQQRRAPPLVFSRHSHHLHHHHGMPFPPPTSIISRFLKRGKTHTRSQALLVFPLTPHQIYARLPLAASKVA